MKVSGLLYRHDVLQASQSCSALFSWKLQIRILIYICGGGGRGSKISIKVICNVASANFMCFIVTKAKKYIKHNVIGSLWAIKVYAPCRIIMCMQKKKKLVRLLNYVEITRFYMNFFSRLL